MVNPSTMRLGIASILIGLVGAWGVRTMMDEEEPVAEKAPPQAANWPVATMDLPEGRVIRRGDVGFVSLTQTEMVERGWQTQLVMANVEDIIGRQLRKRLSLHSPFLTTDLFLDGDGPRYKVRDGYRAAQVTVPTSFGGHVGPGATVDLSFTSEEKEGKGDKPSIPVKTIRVAAAVQVLDVLRPSPNYGMPTMVGQRGRSSGPAPDPTFTLEVEPEIAMNINTLRSHGQFSMVERPAGDLPLPTEMPRHTENSEGPADLLTLLGIEEPEPETGPAIWTTEYVRGGGKSALQFPVSYAPPPPQDPDQVAQGGNPPGAARGPQPTPAGPPPAGSQPPIPYRAGAPTDEAFPRPPVQTPTPAVDASGTPLKAADPFVDDPQADDPQVDAAPSDEVFPR